LAIGRTGYNLAGKTFIPAAVAGHLHRLPRSKFVGDRPKLLGKLGHGRRLLHIRQVLGFAPNVKVASQGQTGTIRSGCPLREGVRV
jgi:hypothetical protein